MADLFHSLVLLFLFVSSFIGFILILKKKNLYVEIMVFFMIFSPSVMIFGYAVFDEYIAIILLLAFFLASIKISSKIQ